MTKGANDLAFLPLGGTGEIGMNLNLYRHAGKWLAIDCGMTEIISLLAIKLDAISTDVVSISPSGSGAWWLRNSCSTIAREGLPRGCMIHG